MQRNSSQKRHANRQPVLHRVLNHLWSLRTDSRCEFLVPLSDGRVQQGTPVAVLYADAFWAGLRSGRKALHLIGVPFEPSHEELRQAADVVFEEEVFGGSEDFGDALMSICAEHCSEDWNWTGLTAHDATLAAALEQFTVLTRTRLRGIHSQPPLNLALANRAPVLGLLFVPMSLKVPVISVRQFVDLHARFAFNEIRLSGHPRADRLIKFLYEILFLQQKIAIALSVLLRASAAAHAQKGDASFIESEMDAIMAADAAIPYLKSSVEKTMALVAETLLVVGFDNLKTQKRRTKSLKVALAEHASEAFYADLLLDLVSTEALSGLNKYRTGLLHKLGASQLQPHRYASVSTSDLPLLEVFGRLHEQHAENSASLVAALALLTDDLVRRKRPGLSREELYDRHRDLIVKLVAAMDAQFQDAHNNSATATG